MQKTVDIHQPKVSIVGLCYNHSQFVQSCLQSVFHQTYQNIELIVVDDGSTDDSKTKIRDFLKDYPKVLFIDLQENIGNCKAFNLGLEASSGEFIIDLATDDILFPDRIAEQVQAFSKLDSDYGVIYSDAVYIDQQDHTLGTHFTNYRPERGNIYPSLISRYFIPPATMMIRRSVFEELGGYDENLAYEDFDFWIRSGRNWKYDFLDAPLTKIRKTSNSLSSRFYQRNSPLIPSTLVVCQKIKDLNKTEEEKQALIQRLTYELKISAVTGNKKLACQFYREIKDISKPNFLQRTYYLIGQFNWNIYGLIRLIRRSGI